MVADFKSVLVLGWGRSGQAAAALLVRAGVAVVATDDSGKKPENLPAGARWIKASGAVDCLGQVDCVVVSPGVPATHRVLVAAVTAGVEVLSELELGWTALVAESDKAGVPRAPLVAITGTNGKSTTVTLAAAMLEADGRRTFAGGNLGSPLCEAVGGGYDALVVEVSSFQLEWVDQFCPDVAVILAVAPDHLDRHGDFETYLATKLKMFARQRGEQHALVSVDGGLAARVESQLRASVATVGRTDQKPQPTFAADIEGRCILREGAELVSLPAHWPQAPHDFSNAAAAVAAVTTLGVGPEACSAALADFQPLAHRLNFVTEKNGVAWWNDSKATNVAATRASLTAFSKPVVLLLGGVPKGEDFSVLAEDATRIRTAVVYGQAAAEIEAALAGKLDLVRCANMSAAVAWAQANTGEGDTVLLAPACASFDEFRNYADRGAQFTAMLH
jgi:UDP-N-acetylmuramoylalanine--D-glutamate ligase